MWFRYTRSSTRSQFHPKTTCPWPNAFRRLPTSSHLARVFRRIWRLRSRSIRSSHPVHKESVGISSGSVEALSDLRSLDSHQPWRTFWPWMWHNKHGQHGQQAYGHHSQQVLIYMHLLNLLVLGSQPQSSPRAPHSFFKEAHCTCVTIALFASVCRRHRSSCAHPLEIGHLSASEMSPE